MESNLHWDCGIIGDNERPQTVRLSQLPCGTGLQQALMTTYGEDLWLTPPQATAIKQGILERDSHFLIATPTNSGKTLIAVLRMFHQALGGHRSLFVTPLKAIAEEKRAEFEKISGVLKGISGRRIRVGITTGDYQLTDDFLDSPPPREGEIIICTPERLEILLRNPEYHAWAYEIKNAVFDEIHLLGEEKRGVTLEVAITRLRQVAPRASILGLSATIGGIDRLRDWLNCWGGQVTVIEDSWRFPPLHMKVTYTVHKNDYIHTQIKAVLQTPENSALIFTYTKEDAKRLARDLSASLDERTISETMIHPGEIGHLMRRGVAYFHAGLTLQQRKWITDAHRANQLRVVVATTSLKMGVNLPATHVFIRDHHFWGKGRLPIVDVLQMLGRAGRGVLPGNGELLVDEESIAESYAEGLRSGTLPQIEPQIFVPIGEDRWKAGGSSRETEERIMQGLVLSEIVARGGASPAEIEVFLQGTFSGFLRGTPGSVQPALQNLLQWHLLQKVEGAEDLYEPRPLGKTTCLAGLHPQTGASLGGFLVALIRLGEREKEKDHGRDSDYLRRLSDLDLLFIACAALEMREQLAKPPSRKRIESVQQYIEMLDPEDKPLLNLWRSESSADKSPVRLMGSLKVPMDSKKSGAAEKKFYQLMESAILLHRHSHGQPLTQLAEEYHLDEGKLEQGLKGTSLWVLSGFAQICDSRKCYKLDFLMLQALELIEKLKYGCGLGPLLKLEAIGKRTLQKLTEAGFQQIKDLETATENGLLSLGLREKQARKIMKVSRKTRR